MPPSFLYSVCCLNSCDNVLWLREIQFNNHFTFFLLNSGGPGSGKITHCDHLARADNRLIHLNMQTTFLEAANEIGSVFLFSVLVDQIIFIFYKQKKR